MHPFLPGLARRTAFLPALLLAVGIWPGVRAHAEPAAFTGTWRFTHAQVAPWADAATAHIQQEWLGQSLTVIPGAADAGGRVTGPHPLQCEKATFEDTRVPAEGLFQGGLPAPARDAALALGLPAGEVPGVSLSCSTGVFEFHRADDTSLLLAVDNVIWTLDRSAGTQAAGDAPEAALQRLLEAHFAGDMAFTTASAAAKRPWLTAELWRAIEQWLARPQPEDEVPAIDGDPFTNSQEYPLRFSVGPARAEADAGTVTVDVNFAFVGITRPVTYVLRREAEGWRVAELRYPDGETFSALLR